MYSPHSHLLCGPHPVRPSREILDALLASGVTCFIDLTEPGEVVSEQYSVSSIQSRNQQAIHRVSESADVPIIINNFEYLNYPIPDFGIPSDAQMTMILDTLDTSLASHHTIYLHCHGGRGRTGTVVGCWLVRHGMTGEQALARIAELRGDYESPETDEQRAFVLNWNEVHR